MRLVLVLFLLSMPFCGVGQVQQPGRYEIELDTWEEEYNVLSGERNGVLLYKSVNEFNDGRQLWKFIKLDTALYESWKKEYYLDRSLVYRGYDYNNSAYSLLFQTTTTSSVDLLLIQLDDYNGDTTHHIIKNLVNIQLEAFEMTNSGAVIGGYYNSEPVIIHYDLRTRKTKILPGIFGNKTKLVQIKVDNDFIKVLLTARSFDNSNTLTLKTYDSNGEYLDSYTFNPMADVGLIFGSVANLANEGSLICGTYGGRKSEFSRGLFIAQHNAEIKQEMRYFNYADLDNFFTYMKAKRQKRISERIDRKKIKGKKVKFNYRLLVHDIVKNGDDYVMLGEAFYPRYNSYAQATSYSHYGTRDYGSSNYMPVTFAGYRYTHAVIIGFNKKGEILWDNSFEIEDVISYQLEQYVHADVMEDKVVLLYLYDNELRTKLIKGSEVLEGKSYNNLKMMFEDDVINNRNSYSSDIGGLEKWYDHNFMAYGVQKIKNMRDSGVKLNRRVFYVNKIRYDRSYILSDPDKMNKDKTTVDSSKK